MYVNRTYLKSVDEYAVKRTSHRVHVKTDATRMPSSALLDRLADEKLTGRYNVRRDNICNTCFTYKSENGSCNC